MIIKEEMIINEQVFIKTYSDNNYMIERDGVQYVEAIDPAECNREYIETNTIIPYYDFLIKIGSVGE